MSAIWIHSSIDELNRDIAVDLNPVEIDRGNDELPGDLATRLQIAIQMILPAALVSFSLATGAFTISNAIAFRVDMSANLAALLGFSTTTLNGSTSYTSDERPSHWYDWEWPLVAQSVSYRWHRYGSVIDDEYLAAQTKSGPREIWDFAVVITEAERLDYIEFLGIALTRRLCAIWPDTTDGIVEATADHPWRLRRYCVILSAGADLIRNSPVRRLYDSALISEVVDAPVLA